MRTRGLRKWGSRGCYRRRYRKTAAKGPWRGPRQAMPGDPGEGERWRGSPPPWVWGTTPRPQPGGTRASGRRAWFAGSRQGRPRGRRRGVCGREAARTQEPCSQTPGNRWLLTWRTWGRAAGEAGTPLTAGRRAPRLQAPRLQLDPSVAALGLGAAGGAGAGGGASARWPLPSERGPSSGFQALALDRWVCFTTALDLDLAFPPDGPQLLPPHW